MFLVPCSVNVEVVLLGVVTNFFQTSVNELISPVILHLASTGLVQLQQIQQPLVCKKKK